MLDPVSIWPAPAACLVAFGTAQMLQRRFGAPPPPGRYAAVDGLRGYLAFGVFLHHACIWYFYQRTGAWQRPPSQFYGQLGQVCVAMFFMITGFLFFSKLLDARDRPIDWLRLFVSRVLRLVPLYLVVMLMLFAMVAMLSGGELHQPLRTVTKQALRWLGFTMFGNPPINGVENTKIIVAAVTWSLRYEWFFYGVLPLLGLTVGVVARWPYLLLGLASTSLLLGWQPTASPLAAFLGGIVTAFVVRSPALCRLARHRSASLLAIACIAGATGALPWNSNLATLALLSIAFMLIACGCTLFGLLLHPASRLLGDMSYGIYLLHGMLLFSLFHFVLRADAPGAALDADAHWAWVLALAPVVVLVGYASFRCIESPAMRATNTTTNVLRRWFQKDRDTQVA